MTLLGRLCILLCLALPAGGQSILQLTRNGAQMDDHSPVMSHDGHVFAWIGRDPATTFWQVWTADSRNLTPRMLTTCTMLQAPTGIAMSGDGTTIVFAGGGNLWKVSPFGGGARQVTTLPAHLSIAALPGGYPMSVTDDGSLAVCTIWDVNRKINDLHVIRTDTGGTVNLTRLTTFGCMAGDVSGNGKRVVYASERGSNDIQLWTCAIDGTGHKQLSTFPDIGWPCIDEQGTWCAFTGRPMINLRVFLIRTDGTGLRAVSPDVRGVMSCAYSLSGDADRVTWISEDRSNGDEYMAFPDGGGLRRLTTGGVMYPATHTTAFRLNTDGTIAIFATHRDLGGGNKEGDAEIYLWRDGLSTQGVATPGGSLVLNLVDPGRPGALYLVRCALGRSPGMTVLGKFIPLNYDALFLLSGLAPAIFADFTGTLDAGGVGAAGIHLPPEPGLVGFVLYASFITVDAARSLAVYNPVRIRVR